MQLEEFMSDDGNAHKEQGNPGVESNALYKAKDSFNCYLTAAQAIALARNLLQKAQLIVEAELEDGVVHLWNTGEANEKLFCGLNKRRAGPRRGKKKPPADIDEG